MKYEEMELGQKTRPSVLPVIAAAVIFPVTVIMWILNHYGGVIESGEGDWEDEGRFSGASPSRWFASVAIPVILIVHALRKKSLNSSGAALALVVGFFHTLSSYCFLMLLLVFFLSSSKATKFRAKKKRLFEEDFKEGGQRNWIQVFCNGGMATQLAIIYICDIGFGQRPINFQTDYRASFLGIGILGALSCANGDTWASEIGSVVTTTVPRLITTWRKVPSGTNGAVTLGGLLVSFMGGLVLGITYYVTILFSIDYVILTNSPPQWPIIVIGGIGGLLGSMLDSFLGATLQYSGSDSQGKIHEIPGENIKHISGISFLDNHSVNLISTILTGLVLPKIALSLWPTLVESVGGN
ncbi:unnamed protein product [Orchesella dallaii]|uniref:Transmembrane protein 19 n=1 Tax=Orchesella dallaii TaxID=48710 RepID=A0ABP1QRN7_9HEXA